jgi:hypothetical protein
VPAAAVIPAPIAYIKVVAVKKLVVEFLAGAPSPRGKLRGAAPAILAAGGGGRSLGRRRPAASFTVNKLRCLKQACRLNTLAWNNEMGPPVPFRWLRTGVTINRDGRGYPYSAVRGEILGFVEDEPLRKHLSSTLSLIKNERLGIEED